MPSRPRTWVPYLAKTHGSSILIQVITRHYAHIILIQLLIYIVKIDYITVVNITVIVFFIIIIVFYSFPGSINTGLYFKLVVIQIYVRYISICISVLAHRRPCILRWPVLVWQHWWCDEMSVSTISDSSQYLSYYILVTQSSFIKKINRQTAINNLSISDYLVNRIYSFCRFATKLLCINITIRQIETRMRRSSIKVFIKTCSKKQIIII